MMNFKLKIIDTVIIIFIVIPEKGINFLLIANC